ncbi:barstar family protein [Streptomyces sp. NPDC059875]|uniref:barstar family protein n=1 Tax=unclassified Streptomyces TaxID=2593676 RepID=UPI00364F444B
MNDADGVFTQFYEHLRLPDYFGWNWNALHDCLSDLKWITAGKCILIVDNAESILVESPGERTEFFRALLRAADHWAGKPDLPGHAKRTLHALFLCHPMSCDEFSQEITRSYSAR